MRAGTDRRTPIRTLLAGAGAAASDGGGAAVVAGGAGGTGSAKAVVHGRAMVTALKPAIAVAARAVSTPGRKVGSGCDMPKTYRVTAVTQTSWSIVSACGFTLRGASGMQPDLLGLD